MQEFLGSSQECPHCNSVYLHVYILELAGSVVILKIDLLCCISVML